MIAMTGAIREKVEAICRSETPPVWLVPYPKLEKACESPIEFLLGVALLRELAAVFMVPHAFNLDVETLDDLKVPREVFGLFPQVKCGPYRIDFVIGEQVGFELHKRVAIECDGHEFHRRDKEEAEREAYRDRYISSRGFSVIRFTGREIWRDPSKCASQACRIMLGEEIEK